MSINELNIDEWLFNHFEGNLNLEQQAQLMDFLEANPSYQADLDAWSQASVDAPEMEFAGMKDLLVEEPADVAVAVAGAGAVAGSYFAWAKWGAGALALFGLLFLGYQTTDSSEYTTPTVISDETNSLNTTTETHGLSDGNSNSYSTAATSTSGANEGGNANAGVTDVVTNNAQTVNAGPETDPSRSNDGTVSNSFFPLASGNGSWMEQLLAELNHPESFRPDGTNGGGNSTVSGNPDVSGAAIVGNPNETIASTESTMTGGANGEPSDETNSSGSGTTELPSFENGQDFEESLNGEHVTMTGAPVEASEEIENEAFREEGYAFNRTRNLAGDRWGEGSFNDPEWARKVLSTPSDPDGDGVRNRDHERAPSYSNFPETGVFPFKVPYKGLGFNNIARDPQLVVPFNNPLLINPALTGSHGEDVIRVQSNARAQWLGSGAAQNMLSLSADSYLKGFGGIGAYASYQNYGKGLYTSNQVGVSIAPVIALTEGKPSRPGATLTLAGRASYVWKHINNESISEQQAVEVQRGEVTVLDNSSSQLVSQFGYQDFAFGAHLNANRFYAGASVDHITQPVEDLYGLSGNEEQRLSRKLVGYVGTDFSKKQESDFVYSPALLYQSQGNLSELWITNTFTYKGLKGGLGYATSNSARLMAGVQFETFEVNYNFDLTDSELMQMNKGSHEIALRWLIK